ncbi:MAG: site-specific DNA-methyltransferase [Gammaproteobacteria bacterium]|nr:site-specific DNA-methyltransferase [Gammaproteobacteria bacterium]
MKSETAPEIVAGDCLRWLRAATRKIDLTFLDPPFNQGRFYRRFNDKQEADAYWEWITEVLAELRAKTSPGGAVYFMHREKNAEFVLRALRRSGWSFQNLIVWKKMASAVPGGARFGKHYQIIAFAANGAKTRVFHKLRIAPPPLPHHKHARQNGVYVTDVWDDIREMTSGYFAGREPLRTADGARFHKQQSPVALLLRIILSSSKPGDLVLDPFAGTGTTPAVAGQLGRRSIGVEIDPENVARIEERIRAARAADCVEKFYEYYRHTENFESIWGGARKNSGQNAEQRRAAEAEMPAA